MKIGVVDYKAGNLRSVETALKRLGADFIISDKRDELMACDKMIFPGVGEAKAAADFLHESGIGQVVKDFAASGKPLLGICLGSQIVLDRSEERNAECLGIIPGSAKEFSKDMGLKVPHMGWNQVEHKNRHWIFADIPEKSSFYFVHSYYPGPAAADAVIGETEYGITFPAAIAKDNVVACQFHPEKSGEVGLKLIKNFLDCYPENSTNCCGNNCCGNTDGEAE